MRSVVYRNFLAYGTIELKIIILSSNLEMLRWRILTRFASKGRLIAMAILIFVPSSGADSLSHWKL